MSPVALPADRRFRRAHVKPARSRRGWRLVVGRSVRYAVILAALVFAARRGTALLTQSRLFPVREIDVNGNERLSVDDVRALLSGLQGQSLVWTDLSVWRRRLMSSPWISDADLRRSLPSTISVTVSERQPIGLARIEGRMYLLDETGVVIDEYGPQYVDYDLPIIDGLSAARGDAVGANEPGAELASRVIAALKGKPEIAGRVSQIDVRDVHNAAVILSGDPAVIQLGEQQFLTRLQSYLEVAPALREHVAGIDSVDLRFDRRIYVRPVAKASKSGVPASRSKR